MLETDKEIEERARAQAEEIAQAQALAQRTPVQQFFSALGRALHLRQPEPEVQLPIAKPGRELLLWQLRQSADVQEALRIAFILFRDIRFIATVPEGRDCPVITFQSRRKWNDAAREWSEMGGGDSQAWLKCDRKLILRKRGGVLSLHIFLRDLCVSFDKKTDKLVPVRVEGVASVDISRISIVMEKFPNLTTVHLANALRAPARLLDSGRARGAPDAYIAGGPLVANMEVFLMEKKKKKDDKEDPGKGFATWLATLLRSTAAK